MAVNIQYQSHTRRALDPDSSYGVNSSFVICSGAKVQRWWGGASTTLKQACAAWNSHHDILILIYLWFLDVNPLCAFAKISFFPLRPL